MDSVRVGQIMWAVLFAVTFGLWLWSRIYKTRVSRNAPVNDKWEQVAPMTECFDDMEEEF